MSVISENTVKAEHQVDDGSIALYLGQAGKRILILGNSITRHGPAADIGWNRDWGMAASQPDKDYVHVLYRLAEAKFGQVRMCALQVSQFERSFHCPEYLHSLEKYFAFAPEIVVGMLGENVFESDCARAPGFGESYAQMIERFCPAQGAQIVLTTCFWRSDTVDSQIRAAAEQRGWGLVELGDLGELDCYKARGLFWHSGVASHPGDAGMEQIARRIWSALDQGREK